RHDSHLLCGCGSDPDADDLTLAVPPEPQPSMTHPPAATLCFPLVQQPQPRTQDTFPLPPNTPPRRHHPMRTRRAFARPGLLLALMSAVGAATLLLTAETVHA